MQSYRKGRALRASISRPSRVALARTANRRYSLPVRIIRLTRLIACAALIASCAPSQPPPAIPIATHVVISRVISENIPPKPPDCAIGTLTAMPTQPYRELGHIQLSDADPTQRDTRMIINQNACAMGADAVIVGTGQGAGNEGRVDATAIAYASNLMNPAAQARSPAAAEEDESAPQLHGPAPFELPLSADDESSSSENSSQSSPEPSPGGGSQSGPATAVAPTPAESAGASSASVAISSPSPDAAATVPQNPILPPVTAQALEVTAATPLATSTPARASTVTPSSTPTMISPSLTPTATPSSTPTASPSPTLTTPGPTPAGSSSPPASATP